MLFGNRRGRTGAGIRLDAGLQRDHSMTHDGFNIIIINVIFTQVLWCMESLTAPWTDQTH